MMGGNVKDGLSWTSTDGKVVITDGTDGMVGRETADGSIEGHFQQMDGQALPEGSTAHFVLTKLTPGRCPHGHPLVTLEEGKYETCNCERCGKLLQCGDLEYRPPREQRASATPPTHWASEPRWSDED